MNNETIGRTLRYAAVVIVGAVVICAFVLVGGPSFNRKLSADKNRIDDLRRLSQEVDRYFEEQRKLPDTLTDLEKLKDRYGRRYDFDDPASKRPYEYKAVDSFSYELCADFELTSSEAKLEESRWGYDDGRIWRHDVGHHCFKFEIPEGKRANKAG